MSGIEQPRPRPGGHEPRRAATNDVVAVASSTGGRAALSQVLGSLPGNLPAAVVVVQHLHASHHSVLAEILGRRTALRVEQASDGRRLRPGRVLVAPPEGTP